MGLNQHEQRQFDQLVAELGRDDPAFVSRVSRHPALVRRIRRTRLVAGLSYLTVMTVLLAAGALRAGIVPSVVVAVFGLSGIACLIGAMHRSPTSIRGRCRHMRSRYVRRASRRRGE